MLITYNTRHMAVTVQRHILTRRILSCPRSVHRLSGITKIRGPLHANVVRFPHPGPRTTASRSRVAIEIRELQSAGLAKYRIASENSC